MFKLAPLYDLNVSAKTFASLVAILNFKVQQFHGGLPFMGITAFGGRVLGVVKRTLEMTEFYKCCNDNSGQIVLMQFSQAIMLERAWQFIAPV